jgi:deoxyribonuclease (pyrimidine dimer)
MTRINVIPVAELTDQHLFAEWRELPRISSYAKKSKSSYNPPKSFTLGTGHVIFFYNKKKWLLQRYRELTQELLVRNYKIQEKHLDLSSLDKYDQIDWVPTEKDQIISMNRINEKIAMKPSWYRRKGEKIS